MFTMHDNATIPQGVAAAQIALNAMGLTILEKLSHVGLELLVFGVYTANGVAAGYRVLLHGMPQTKIARAALVACLAMYSSSIIHVTATLHLLATETSDFHAFAHVVQSCVTALRQSGLGALCLTGDGEYNAVKALLAPVGQGSKHICISTAVSLKRAWPSYLPSRFAWYWTGLYIFTWAIFSASIYYPFTIATFAERMRAYALVMAFWLLAGIWPQALLAEYHKPKVTLSPPARIAHVVRQALDTGTLYVLLWTVVGVYGHMYLFFGSGPFSPLALRFAGGAHTFVDSALVHVAGAHATLLLTFDIEHRDTVTLRAVAKSVALRVVGDADEKHQPL